jgi:hypothetical protein
VAGNRLTRPKVCCTKNPAGGPLDGLTSWVGWVGTVVPGALGSSWREGGKLGIRDLRTVDDGEAQRAANGAGAGDSGGRKWNVRWRVRAERGVTQAASKS